MKKGIILCIISFITVVVNGQFSIENNRLIFKSSEKLIVSAPEEGLWSVATGWDGEKPVNYIHTDAYSVENSGNWTILKGELPINDGMLLLRDSYKQISEGLVKCIRRYEWTGKDTLKDVTLSVRFKTDGIKQNVFLPGILFYGNSNGARINSNIVPVFNGTEGEFAVFEEHRYPMPFAMLENSDNKYAAAIHTIPSPIRGAVITDQWWSLGVEAKKEHSELVLYSGYVGYNRQHSVVKALQSRPMKYENAYINMEPGQIIQKEFLIEYYTIEDQGTGFQRPVHTSLSLNKPFYADRFPTYDEIVTTKYRFAKSRIIKNNDVLGFNMHDEAVNRDIVMGWCGQADSPGYALQVLSNRLGDDHITEVVQKSLDFLSSYPIYENGIFATSYDVNRDKYSGGDPVSCGQAMYNFAKAIEKGRKNKKLNTKRWEAFLEKAANRISAEILKENWQPRSTAEAYYIAPLAIASKLFKNNNYKYASIKIADMIIDRHYHNASYWGGTLDATCEDKEGALAALQGFLELYERFGQTKYLKNAKHAMDVALSYAYVWDVPIIAGRMADHNFKSTGWTGVSPQNQHIDVFAVFFTPYIYKMGVYLKDENLKQFSKVMYRSCFQLTDPYGSQGEQVQQTNFAQRGDMRDVYKLRGGYSENWTVFWITAHFLNAAAQFEEMGVEL